MRISSTVLCFTVCLSPSPIYYFSNDSDVSSFLYSHTSIILFLATIISLTDSLTQVFFLTNLFSTLSGQWSLSNKNIMLLYCLKPFNFKKFG